MQQARSGSAVRKLARALIRRGHASGVIARTLLLIHRVRGPGAVAAAVQRLPGFLVGDRVAAAGFVLALHGGLLCRFSRIPLDKISHSKRHALPGKPFRNFAVDSYDQKTLSFLQESVHASPHSSKTASRDPGEERHSDCWNIRVRMAENPDFLVAAASLLALTVAVLLAVQVQSRRALQGARAETARLSRELEQSRLREEAVRAEQHVLLEQALRVSARKDEFLSALAHELRTPLGAIEIWVEILKTGSLSPDAVQSVEIIQRSTRALARLDAAGNLAA